MLHLSRCRVIDPVNMGKEQKNIIPDCCLYFELLLGRDSYPGPRDITINPGGKDINHILLIRGELFTAFILE